MTTLAKTFDALVMGGGPGGATAALLLAEAGWSVVLVERKIFPRRKVCGEYLSATNWPLLEMLGLAEAFAELAGPPVTRTAIFVGGSSVQADLPRHFRVRVHRETVCRGMGRGDGRCRASISIRCCWRVRRVGVSMCDSRGAVRN